METRPISTEEWNRVEAIFLEVVDLPASEQGTAIRAACAGDERVRAEVNSLLVADRSGDAKIASAIGAEADVLLQDSRLLGARLGDYRVLQELGRGGMG